MKEMASRILLGCIGIPLLLLVLLFPLPFNGLLNAVILLFTALGSLETVRLLQTKEIFLNRAVAVTGTVLPPLTVLAFLYLPNTVAALAAGAVMILWLPLILGREAFSRTAESWNRSLTRTAGYGFILIYPGLLSASLTAFQTLTLLFPDKNIGLVYLIYLMMIFTNDTMAYFTGVAVGRFTPHPAPLSPKKSLAGFIGGGLSTVAVSAGAFYIFPALFDNSIGWALTAGTVLAFAGIIGDLIESAFKRSAGVKDSGTLMMGRGGVLDSLDSVLYGSPFFLVLLLGIHLI